MVLEVNNITKQYAANRGAIDVSFHIERGEIYGLLGPNGSGKTTVMKMVTGLIQAKDGNIKIFGHDIVDETAQALNHVGSLIEAPAIIPYLSAYKNLQTIARFYENPYDIDSILDIVGLTAVKNDKADKYSLGMKQRLGLAMAIIGRPDLLVLDEPTNGLDIESTVTIRNLILHLSKNGATVLISSHLSSELQQMCSTVGVMKNARLLGENSIDVVLDNFESLESYYIHVVKSVETEMAGKFL